MTRTTPGFRRDPRRAPSSARGTAVVIGSGMGGLLAARVLLDHFDRVTLLDRDRFPESPTHRSGVPQSHHAHGLLLRGREIIEELFPGIEEDLRAAGATVERDRVPFQVVSPFGPLPLTPINDEFGVYSRFLLEWQVRERLVAHSRLRLLGGTEVVGLDTGGPAARPGSARVTGVRVRHRGADIGATSVLAADLVVDASGRRSKAPDWLRELGYGEVAEETITSGIGYASRFYAKPDGFPGDWSGIVVNGRAPDNPRSGLVLGIEKDQWHVTLGGFAGAAPPTDEAGFLQWARDLPDPTVYECIRIARPLTPIRGHRTLTNRLRHFERLTRWPPGFVVTADAVCAFNPIYGQGMTVAATDALVLGECLRDHTDPPRGGVRTRPGFEREFQRRLAKNVATAWMVASSEDLRWPGIALHGARPRRGGKAARRWIDLVLRAAVADPYLSERYFNLIMMMASPATMFGPRVLAHVARAAITGGLGVPSREFGLTDASLATVRALPDAHPVAGGGSAAPGHQGAVT
ncbi:FAD-dependent oxidoreductase [Thermomonospora umbrina]|uniref:2-polyprenyl-6-methoxyphenol hydroxylase-like FAD-dependent oxidoreductase n=1 Tax=Thermomonospora umbrina TaxID=111806 RepID=A0A3D9SY69_9ACTN|nr:2-polyprenyl-6-methoxyphenol hydroxylase-like oxidoreductase [Thermomonospora umbrina]REF00799.1 2-polyprenyl-6-methoxyphenol hydroxylase-like FAD-dependent oxidoreductase [Thermomonospora umbrina]